MVSGNLQKNQVIYKEGILQPDITAPPVCDVRGRRQAGPLFIGGVSSIPLSDLLAGVIK
jgi:hypothetical protein